MFACWWGLVGSLIGALIFAGAMALFFCGACVLLVLNSDTDLEL